MHLNKTCFLIDDDTDDQEVFMYALSSVCRSLTCVFANDGVEALDKITTDEGFCPDYIFLDMNMPRMDGKECLRELKKINRLGNVPIIMYSTSSDKNLVQETKKLGAADYIVKPSRIEVLVKSLADLFGMDGATPHIQ